MKPLPAFVEDFGLALAGLGFPRMPARVFALMLAAPEDTQTAKDLAGRLEVSPAAISGAVRYLTQIGLAQRSRRTGERVDRYGLGSDVWAGVFRAEIEAYGPLSALCDKALDSGELAQAGSERVAETRDFLLFMTDEMPRILERWRASRQA